MTELQTGRGLPGHLSLSELRAQLRLASPPYHLISPIGADEARFYFSGPFEDREIVWQAHLMTLERYVQQGCESGRYRRGDSIQLQPFIDISEADIEPLPILIVHDIPEVDAGRLLKTVIMIRNYKRLHRGHHPYGEAQHFEIDIGKD